jgi:hypothetical protein
VIARFVDIGGIDDHHCLTFLFMCDVKVFLTFTFTEYGTVLTTVLPILFLYLNTVIVTAGDFEP